MVVKKILSNGFTIIVSPQFQIPKVSLQLWYDVGAKDEATGEKGMAHLIEHMIFKGTQKLSESDINLIVHKLSGVCNAFTSHDYTGYLFDLPSHHWQYALPIMADCMINCSFKDDLLNSELKAVIQELKMYNDDYGSTLLERMISAIFPDHPYHYPVIGYKADLWSLKRDTLLQFYKRHYVPNNATLVVVGAVRPEEVFIEAEKNFGPIPQSAEYKRATYYHSSDIVSQTVTMYRDIQQPFCMLTWVVPGASHKMDYLLDITSWLLGGGKGSRLTHLLVDKYELATEFETFVYDLFDYGLFVINFQPRNASDIDKIVDIITQELASIAAHGVTEQELLRAIKKTEMDFISVGEDNQKHAYLLGKYYIATKDEHYLEHYCDYPKNNLAEEIRIFVQDYLRPSIMHRGTMLPLASSEKAYWLKVQEKSDEEDARVLSRVVRETGVEEGISVHAVDILPATNFDFPKANSITLSNGLRVFYYNNPNIPKIDLVVDLKARSYYDEQDKQGLQLFMMDLLQEGTENFSGQEFAHELESYGMSLSTFPGQITLSMLSADAQKGLSLLHELVTRATFDAEAIERVRAQILSDINDYWDNPAQFIAQLAHQEIYKNHPYSKQMLGTKESIPSITRDDIVAAYHAFVTPQETRIAIVGDLSKYDVKELLESTLGSWQGPSVPTIQFPELHEMQDKEIKFQINRDQVVLAFAGLSVNRFDQDYDKLLLFDQILTGGVLGSMSSRLFELREATGLFYTIGGSLILGSRRERGMSFIKTVVSHDRLAEAEKMIANVLDAQARDLLPKELEEAKLAITNSLVDNFASNRQIAATFLFLDQFKFPATFFDTRAQQLEVITLAQVQEAVARHLSTSRMVKIKIGRF